MFPVRGGSTATLFAVLTCVGCTELAPDLPPDPTYSVTEILISTTCELQHAFRKLKGYDRFKPDNWLIAISLTPKVDTDFMPGFGLTRKVPTTANAERVTTWVLGAAPGVTLDLKGERTGGVTFNIKSADLKSTSIPTCTQDTPTKRLLARNLGVGAWLQRTAEAAQTTPSVEIDKPSYNTEITIKFGGSGSYTYTFAHGTDLASLAGSYSLDEQLNISMTAIAPKIRAVTLPNGEDFRGQGVKTRAVTSTFEIESAKGRLDTMGLENAIRSLKLSPQ